MICSHRAVADAAVLGVNDERLGQRVVAVLELSATADAADEVALVADIQSYCRDNIARYKVPEQIQFVDKLPRNAMNKIVKPQLLHFFE